MSEIKNIMARKKVVQHRILDLTATLFVIVVITTLRAVFMPSGDESIPNTITPIGNILQHLQEGMPTLSVLVWGITLMFASLDAGR